MHIYVGRNDILMLLLLLHERLLSVNVAYRAVACARGGGSVDDMQK